VTNRWSWLGAALVAGALAPAAGLAQPAESPARDQVLETMKRATTFMVDRVSVKGGYVWDYLPDLSRRWGELEARDTMIWIQPPGTATMGHLFLDAYRATGDEYYYRAAEQVTGALIWAQHRSGGWNYVADWAGDRSLRDWYATVGRNAWRLEEFHHYYDNATFDDEGTIEAARLLLRMYVERHDPKYKPALDRAIQFVLDSQFPIGGWPQRYPLSSAPEFHGSGDYTTYITFNDDVAAENIGFLIQCYQVLGEQRLLEPVSRGMNAFLVTQMGPPQPGWALQYTPDLQPAGARTYEPRSLVTHTTAANIGLLLRFYRLTGETKFLARIPEALDWLEALRLPPGLAPEGRTHPTFVEVGTNRPLYVHREGSNVVNGRYFVDDDPRNTITHYGSFRHIDVEGLRKEYAAAKALSPEQATMDSPLRAGAGRVELPRYFVAGEAAANGPRRDEPAASGAARLVRELNAEGWWPARLSMTSHPYRGAGSPVPAAGDFSRTLVGDESDTSPFRAPDDLIGISTAAYIRNMSALIRHLDETR
jgi:PelA/Pel-15E family pectate lyase